jgi:hypothetical protein
MHTDFKLSQSWKQHVPIDVTVSGMRMESMLHQEKHSVPSDVRPSGNDIFLSDVQPEKHPSPSDFVPAGSDISAREVLLAKHCFGIVSNGLLKFTDVNSGQPLKQQQPKCFTEPGMTIDVRLLFPKQ